MVGCAGIIEFRHSVFGVCTSRCISIRNNIGRASLPSSKKETANIELMFGIGLVFNIGLRVNLAREGK